MSDQYCALCGAVLGKPPNRECDTSLVDEETAAWMNDVRLIGQTTESRVYVTGPARYVLERMYFDLDSDDDSKGPDIEDKMISAYNMEDPLAVPYHFHCFDLLCKKLGTGDIDTEVLFRVFESFCPGDEARLALNIDYGDIMKYQQHYPVPQEGMEHFICSPTEIGTLLEYYGSLSLCRSSDLEQSSGPKKAGAPQGGVFTLPREIMHMVLAHLTTDDVLRLQASSKTMQNLKMDHTFWRKRIRDNMPWLYDLPGFTSDTIYWLEIYKRLLLASKRSSDECVLGLVNRRRIWGILDQLVEPYRGRLSV